MKILNLYSGIGGNRKLWSDEHQITSVEYNPQIATIYQDFFPQDELVVGDAHQYLLKHFEEFDFIWSSPPCPSHSDIRRVGVSCGQCEAVYPEMSLYQEIILLKHFFKGKWVVENVVPYYKPLIPAKELHRHLFWTNFDITHRNIEEGTDVRIKNIKGADTVFGFNLNKYQISGSYNKRKILRNMVNPQLGLHILNEAIGVKSEIFQQESLF